MGEWEKEHPLLGLGNHPYGEERWPCKSGNLIIRFSAVGVFGGFVNVLVDMENTFLKMGDGNRFFFLGFHRCGYFNLLIRGVVGSGRLLSSPKRVIKVVKDSWSMTSTGSKSSCVIICTCAYVLHVRLEN